MVGMAAAAAVGMKDATTMAGGTATEAAGPGLEPPAEGEEDCLILGRKLCPPRVFTMDGLEKGSRWRGWEEERFQK